MKSFVVHYDLTLAALAALVCLPYFFLLAKSFERFILTSKGITKRGLFRSQTILWRGIFEYRDMLSYIELVPIKRKNCLNIDNYCNLKEIERFNNEIIHRCEKVEANLLVRNRSKHLIPVKPSPFLIFILLLLSGIAVIFLDVDIALLGIMGGITYVYLSFIFFLLHRMLNPAENPSPIMHYVMYLLLLLIPIVLLSQPLWGSSFGYVVAQAGTYLVGFLAGSGLTSFLLPERKSEEEGRRIIIAIK